MDSLAQSLNEEKIFNVTELFLSNVYGPSYNYWNHPSLIPNLIKSCLLAKYKNTDWVINGDPDSERDYLFIEDINRVIQLLIKKNILIEKVIISSGERCKTKEIAGIIAGRLNFQNNLVFVQISLSIFLIWFEFLLLQEL